MFSPLDRWNEKKKNVFITSIGCRTFKNIKWIFDSTNSNCNVASMRAIHNMIHAKMIKSGYSKNSLNFIMHLQNKCVHYSMFLKLSKLLNQKTNEDSLRVRKKIQAKHLWFFSRYLLIFFRSEMEHFFDKFLTLLRPNKFESAHKSVSSNQLDFHSVYWLQCWMQPSPC